MMMGRPTPPILKVRLDRRWQVSTAVRETVDRLLVADVVSADRAGLELYRQVV